MQWTNREPFNASDLFASNENVSYHDNVIIDQVIFSRKETTWPIRAINA